MEEILAGRNAVLEALNAGRSMSRIVVLKSARSEPRLQAILQLAGLKGIRIDELDRQALDRLAGHTAHQGIIAYTDTRPAPTLSDLLDLSRARAEAGFYVVLDGIEDPHNLGAILRTAEATGAHGVVTREHRAVGLTPAAAKAAAGAAEYVPLVRVPNISRAIDFFKKNGAWIVGIDGGAKQVYLDIDFRPATAIVVGAEGKGISPLVKKSCDFLARIPMKGKITSLNASVAAAVIMYEVLRQRTGQPTG